MKLLSKVLSLLILSSCALFYMSCDNGGDPEKSDEEKQLEQLVFAWTLQSATLDDVDRTADFPNFVLTLSGTPGNSVFNYAIAGTTPARSPWPRSTGDGTWIFGQNPLTDIIRDPDSANETPMNYTVNGNSLVITFNIDPGSDGWPGGSRVEAVSGEWVFTFTR